MSGIGTSRHSRSCNIAVRYWSNNGHWPALTLSGSAANDPKRTLSTAAMIAIGQVALVISKRRALVA